MSWPNVVSRLTLPGTATFLVVCCTAFFLPTISVQNITFFFSLAVKNLLISDLSTVKHSMKNLLTPESFQLQETKVASKIKKNSNQTTSSEANSQGHQPDGSSDNLKRTR